MNRVLLPLALLTLAFLFGKAHAVETTIVCTPPTQNTDDSPVTNLAGFKLYGGISNTVRQTGTVCRFTETNLTQGDHVWYVTAFTTTGNESPPTNPVHFMVDTTPPPPPPPPVFSTTSTVVYSLLAGADTFAPLIVGTVPLGTPCNASQKLLAFNVIPRSAVTFTGPIKPVAVLALCGP